MTTKATDIPEHPVDFLVTGSGIAGLSFALSAAECGKVLLISKADLDDSTTNLAQGGIASALAGDDSCESHAADTLESGAGLCHEDAVRLLVEEGPGCIDWLVERGTSFTRDSEGSLDLGREGGHTRNRIVHADDLTGAEIARALLAQARAHPNISLLDHWMVVDLITPHHLEGGGRGDGGPCYGVYCMPCREDGDWRVRRVLSRITLLATGGSGRIYLHTTNPSISTGDGVALAYRAGAELANLEFFQFHPSALYHPDASNWLISEALRGYGARLVNDRGAGLMDGAHPLRELAPRDVVARCIDEHLKRSGESCAYIDCRHLDQEELRRRFPNITAKCDSLGIDVGRDPIPVVPAAHYQCGGILTDLEGRSSLERLYAVGEAACTGVHGANRLASNSLLEAVVFARRAGRAAIRELEHADVPAGRIPEWDVSGTFDSEEWVLVEHDRTEVRRLMWDYVGIVRSRLRLLRARSRILLIAGEIEDYYRRTRLRPGLVELRNLVAVAYLTIKCALFREESRGLHYRSDYPQRDDDRWHKDTVVRRSSPGETSTRDLP